MVHTNKLLPILINYPDVKHFDFKADSPPYAENNVKGFLEGFI